jgi:Zn-dependent protease/predicted transcriptional regulator
MGWSVKIGRIMGTEIRIHLTFLIFLLWLGFVYYRGGGAEAAINGVLFIVLLFLCVLLHELGHALMARRFGILTPDITLLPIGGVARLQRMPEQPAQEIAVALAGPAVNVVIAAVLILFSGGRIDPLDPLPGPGVSLAMRLAQVNIFLVLFNLIPAFPMDGGRVLRALIATRMPYFRATKIAATVGQGFAFLFGFFGLLWNPMLIFIALFIYIAASQEAAVASLRDVTGWVPVSEAMVTDFAILSPNATAGEAADALLRTSQHEFPIVDADGSVRGILTRDAIIAALQRGGPSTPVLAISRRDVPVVRNNASIDEAFQLMQQCDCPALPVVDPWGRLVGIITTENVGELMMIRSVAPAAVRLSHRRAAA